MQAAAVPQRSKSAAHQCYAIKVRGKVGTSPATGSVFFDGNTEDERRALADLPEDRIVTGSIFKFLLESNRLWLRWITRTFRRG